MTPDDQVRSVFPDRVRDELARARRLHPPIHSLHEGFAVILEEIEEFWELVRRDPRAAGGCSTAMCEELVQVAAMCQRVAEDALPKTLGFLDPRPFTISVELDDDRRPLNPEP